MPKSWTFENFGDEFDSHVCQHLPWYRQATQLTADLVRSYLPANGLIYDIGASTGNVGRALEALLAERGARLVALECDRSMVDNYQGPGEVVQVDATRYRYKAFDVAVLFLSLSFIPIAERGKLLAQLRRKMRSGGALLIVDKQTGVCGHTATALQRTTPMAKLRAGVTPAEIADKDLSLAGVQRPLDVMSELGVVTEYFRYGEFAGWLIEAT